MNTWGDEEEVFLKKISKQCLIYKYYYDKKHEEYKKYFYKFNIPIILISSVNSLLAISLNEFVEQSYVSIINSILSAGAGILSSILLFLKIQEKLNSTRISSLEFQHLNLKISKELSLKRDDRNPNSIQFLNDIFNSYNSIIDQSLPIEKKNMLNFVSIEEYKKENIKKKISFLNLEVLTSSTSSSEEQEQEQPPTPINEYMV
jgi:hypothetical protein